MKTCVYLVEACQCWALNPHCMPHATLLQSKLLISNTRVAAASKAQPRPMLRLQRALSQRLQHLALDTIKPALVCLPQPALAPSQHAGQTNNVARVDAAVGTSVPGRSFAAVARTPEPSTAPASADYGDLPGSITASALNELKESHVLRYFNVERRLMPEAFREYYTIPALREENISQPKGGCQSVQDEFIASTKDALMYRQCMHELSDMVAKGKRRKECIYLDGQVGSGKSVALFSLALWARQNGWLVVYVPSAYAFIEGGFFAVDEEDGMVDAWDAALLLLRSIMDSHADMLQGLKASDGSGKSLADIAQQGLMYDGAEPQQIVRHAIQLLDEIAKVTDVKVLVCVDDYNVLYSHSDYHEWPTEHHMRMIGPDRIRLAKRLRFLEGPKLANGVIVCAPTYGQTVSPQIHISRPKLSAVQVPRFDFSEVLAQGNFYHIQKQLVDPVDEDVVREAFYMTMGNPRELRKRMDVLLVAWPTD